jgi:hypothetical protein
MGPSSSTDEAESWFLARGLPSVLTARGRVRRLWPRSAPVLAAYATAQACTVPIHLITGGHNVDIEGTPTAGELVLLAIIAAILPLSALVGWLVSRLAGNRARAIAGTVAVLVVAIVTVIEGGGLADAPAATLTIAATLLLTAAGVGSVVGWVARMLLSHLATVGALAVRALPVVLLTALVFFNGYVWLMAATINGKRLVLAMTFLVLLAVAFVVSATLERVRPILQSPAALAADREALAATPFADMPDPHSNMPLKWPERFNVVFVLVASQFAQILVLAVITVTVYLVLGLIVLTPALLNEWTHTYVSTAVVLGWRVPVPDSLIHICLFLGALTFMYISARAAGDAEYRSTFLDPLIEDLRATLTARNRYRARVAAADGEAFNM